MLVWPDITLWALAALAGAGLVLTGAVRILVTLTSRGRTDMPELALGGLSLADVEAILLTHIHLDHAGAAGALVRRFPDLPVYVHERGAPHLAPGGQASQRRPRRGLARRAAAAPGGGWRLGWSGGFGWPGAWTRKPRYQSMAASRGGTPRLRDSARTACGGAGGLTSQWGVGGR